MFIASIFTSEFAGVDPLCIDVGSNLDLDTVIVSSLGGLTLSFEFSTEGICSDIIKFKG